MKKYTKLNIRNKKFPQAAKKATFKMKLKKGDTVLVKTGKDKGKKGAIVKVLPALNKIIVEGVAVHKRHSRKVRGQSGTIIEQAMPINASNVMLVDPKSNEATRVKRVTTDGKNVRTSVKSGTALN